MRLIYIVIIGVFVGAVGCKSDGGQVPISSDSIDKTPVHIPAFNRDSAYAHVETQLSFGPRNPGSQGIATFRTWLVAKLESQGAIVVQQDFAARFYNDELHASTNIIAQFYPGKSKRILLGAHFDTRFIADQDKDESRKDEPIPGADDGGSGVAVLIELGRMLQQNPIDIGVDMIFFDAEDQGESGEGNIESWCIGAQYWSKKPHKSNYKPKYGILLDMVGAKNAFFNKENVQGQYPHFGQVHKLYDKVWKLARAMGKGRFFQERRINWIIDDHYFVNKNAGIPMIDIINKPVGNEQGFGAHWHTHNDDIGIIDKNTLGAVGQVVAAVLYREAAGQF